MLLYFFIVIRIKSINFHDINNNNNNNLKQFDEIHF